MENTLVGERVFAKPPHRARQRMQGGRASRTPGKLKNEWCQTDPQKKYFACNPKARFHPQYEVWNARFRLANSGSKAG